MVISWYQWLILYRLVIVLPISSQYTFCIRFNEMLACGRTTCAAKINLEPLLLAGEISKYEGCMIYDETIVEGDLVSYRMLTIRKIEKIIIWVAHTEVSWSLLISYTPRNCGEPFSGNISSYGNASTRFCQSFCFFFFFFVCGEANT